MNKLSQFHISIAMFVLLMSFHNSKSAGVESVCYGSTHNGALAQAFQLPLSGDNFKTYSQLGWFLGRTYLHSKVAAVTLETYKQLYKKFPEKKFMYAETGWALGGDFAPHKTHQNGLSVDFMVPVLNAEGESDYLPVGINNRWGYDIEFNAEGKYKMYRIDFEILAMHLKLLHENANKAGFSIKRVYIDPRLQPQLFKTVHGDFIKRKISFNDHQAWVRHDEHYHVDFEIRCLSLE